MLATILSSGGASLWAIGACSLVGLAVAVERCWRLLPLDRRWRRRLDALERTRQIDRATSDDDALGRVIARAMATAPQGPDLARAMALEAAQQEVPALERGLGVLATVAQIAPLLGLLGTVIGLMEAFEAARAAPRVTPGLLADGLYKALGTTVAGLCVAIPAWIAHNFLAGVSGRLIDRLERAAVEIPLLAIRG